MHIANPCYGLIRCFSGKKVFLDVCNMACVAVLVFLLEVSDVVMFYAGVRVLISFVK